MFLHSDDFNIYYSLVLSKSLGLFVISNCPIAKRAVFRQLSSEYNINLVVS